LCADEGVEIQKTRFGRLIIHPVNCHDGFILEILAMGVVVAYPRIG
jgi:hypothetical protein